MSDETLGRRLAAELPRYTAPAALRDRIAASTRPRPTRPVWLAPTLAALATAALLILFVIPRMPHTTPADAVNRLVGAVVAEHTRVLLWGARRPDVIPIAAEEAGIRLARAFVGDERLRFVAAEPVYLDWRRGIALHYRDVEGHDITYVAIPAPGMPVPDRYRVNIQMPDRVARPALIRSGGFATWFWKQGDLACFIVSDLVAESDLATFKEYWIRMRVATEPQAF